MIPALIDEYELGGDKLKNAIDGLSAADFLALPVPNTWSIGQIVIHLMDSDLIASDRMKRIIAEDNPTIIGFDETAFSQKLYAEKQNPFLAAEIFAGNRKLTAVILRNLPESAYNRFGTHNQRGRVTLGELVTMYVHHLDHHLKFIHHKRKLLGR